MVFDLGKVLLDFDYSIAGRRIAALSRLPAAEVQQFIDHSPLFFAEVQTTTGFRGTLEECCRFFADIFTPIEPMVNLHAELQARGGVPTYIFSNTNELAVGHIRSRFPFFSRFDDCILSYQHGALKPDARLYEVVEQCAGVSGPEILYFDDRPENVAAGAARAWRAILHEAPEKSRAVVVSAGLLPGPGG